MSKQTPSYAQKINHAAYEAKVAGVGLLLTIIVWCVLGFGLSNVDVAFFGIPLWVWAGCLGTWAFAIIFSIYMARHVISDVPLDSPEDPTKEAQQTESSQR